MPHVIYDTLSLKQFLRLPEAKPALEYIDGLVVQKVSPKRKHSVISSMFIARLITDARTRRQGFAYNEMRCTFDGRSLVPDISFVASGRIPKDARGDFVDDIFLAPDLVIEILSPGQTVKDLSSRLTWCVGHGVRLGWLIQPTKRRVYVFRPDQPRSILEEGETLDGSDVLPGFQLPLAEIFGWLLED
jgi:Uma2 family endonuclease